MSTYQSLTAGTFIRVGVVGCGRVGRSICFGIDGGRVDADLSAVCDTDADKVQDLLFQLKRPARSMSLTGLVSSVDLVIEATNRHIAPTVIMAAINGGKDIVVTNSAAIFARRDFPRLAHERGLNIYAVNALLTGTDTLNTSSASPGAQVTLSITCPVAVLAQAPFMRGREIRVTDGPRPVFQGEAADAMHAFPGLSNIIAAALLGTSEELVVRIRAHEFDNATDIQLDVFADKQQTSSRTRVESSQSEPIAPEAIGLAVVGFLRWLVSPVRLT
jgi:aspartate dehydrogenase